MNKLALLSAILCGVTYSGTAELIRNGSFEHAGPKQFPAGWNFSVKHTEKAQAQVTAEYRTATDAADGKKLLQFRNPINRVNDVYGSIFQDIRVEPGKRYRISFLLRGKNVNQFLVIMGREWATRWTVPTGNLKPDQWRFFSHEFVARPQEIDKDGRWMVRFNIEDYAAWGELDRVSVVPTEGEIISGTEPAAIHELPGSSRQDLFAAELLLSGLTRPAGWQAGLTLTDADGKKQEKKLGPLPALNPTETLRLQVVVPLRIEMAYGPFSAEVSSEGACLVSGKFHHRSSGMAEEAENHKRRMNELKERMRLLAERTSRAESGRAPSRHLNLFPEIAANQLKLSERDVNRPFRTGAEREYYVLRNRIALHELQLLLDEWEKDLRKAEKGIFPPETFRTLSGKLTMKNGFQHGITIDEKGRRVFRPILFGGFGHFEQVIRDIPFLSKLGVNIIQIEIGPSSLFPREGRSRVFEPDYTDYNQRIERALKRAHDEGVRIALLTSTHYVPKWLIRKFQQECPEALAPGGHYLPLDPLHPRTREMHRAFLEALTARLAASPYRDALQSIVLANEPAYGQCQLDREFSRNEFRKALKQRHGSIRKFNRVAGTSFQSFDQLLAAGEKNPAVKYEYNMFKWQAFADWHRFMAQIVRKNLPEVPLHTKLMIYLTLAERELGWSAYEPGMLAEFFDVNGNDNGNDIWLDPAVGTELQYSLKPVMINNTENHLFPNVYPNPVPASRIYTAIFQQYLYGAGNLVSWVWQDNRFGGPQWCEGGIMQRPMNIWAHQRAVLDANRLAEEILLFVRAEPEMAILYSPTSLILNRRPYTSRIYEIYRTLAPLGYKVRFISEKQLAENDFRKVKLLIAGETKQIRSDAAAGIRKFIQHGGKVVTIGTCFQENEYGRKLTPAIKSTARATIQTLKTAVQRTLPPLPFSLQSEQLPNRQYPIHARHATLPDGRILLNLINYGGKTQSVSLNRPARDLISGRKFSGKISLPQNEPFLLELQSSSRR